MEIKAVWMSNDKVDENKVYEKFSDAARIIFEVLAERFDEGNGMALMELKQMIWLECVIDSHTYLMKFYCLRDFARIIGFLCGPVEDGQRFSLAKKGDFVEPNDQLLKYAFALSMQDAMWESFVSADHFPDTLEDLIECFKVLGMDID